jgi:hypothetical protein
MVKCGRCNSRKKSRSRLRRKSRRMRGGGACTHAWKKQTEKAREKDGADYNYKCSKCSAYCDESVSSNCLKS